MLPQTISTLSAVGRKVRIASAGLPARPTRCGPRKRNGSESSARTRLRKSSLTELAAAAPMPVDFRLSTMRLEPVLRPLCHFTEASVGCNTVAEQNAWAALVPRVRLMVGAGI